MGLRNRETTLKIFISVLNCDKMQSLPFQNVYRRVMWGEAEGGWGICD